MALECDPLVVDLAQLTQGDDLKAARVREDRPIPGHELVQPAERGYPFVARPQVEVVRVREDDRRADSPNIVRIECLDGGVGAHRHELGRFDDAVWQRQSSDSGLRRAIRGWRHQYLELSWRDALGFGALQGARHQPTRASVSAGVGASAAATAPSHSAAWSPSERRGGGTS